MSTESLGLVIEEVTLNSAKARRRTTETLVEARVDLERKELEISTGLAFLDHMIQELSWLSCMGIGIVVKPLRGRKLTHTLAEDSGITLGNALRSLYVKRANEFGLNGSGFSISVLDEAMSMAVISIEGRRNAYIRISCEGGKRESVEDMHSADLIAFIEGLSQGMGATIHLDLLHGLDPHHCWETAFRALGEAIRKAFEKNTWRKGAIVGVKGTLD